jgi:hypothetical protein
VLGSPDGSPENDKPNCVRRKIIETGLATRDPEKC